MPSLQSLTLGFSTLIAITAAQTTTVIIPNLYAEEPDGSYILPTASVVSANPTATTLDLKCPSQDCGLFPKQTLIYGPSTWHVDMADPNPDAFTGTMDCKFASSSAVCTESFGGSEANFPGTSISTYEWEGLATMQVVVTAGADKLGSVDAQATASLSTASETAKATTTPATMTTETVKPSGAAQSGPDVKPSGAASGGQPEATNAAGVNGVERGVVGVAVGALAAWLL